jgi:transporter family-2 protein
MKLAYLVLTFVVGLVLALHFSMNAAVGKITENVRMGNAVFWLIGAGMATVIGLSGWQGQFLIRVREVPVGLWFAGVIGACLVCVIVALIPRLGAGTTNVILLAGQVIGGIIIAHFGLLGSPTVAITPVRVVGVVVMITGASIVVLV